MPSRTRGVRFFAASKRAVDAASWATRGEGTSCCAARKVSREVSSRPGSTKKGSVKLLKCSFFLRQSETRSPEMMCRCSGVSRGGSFGERRPPGLRTGHARTVHGREGGDSFLSTVVQYDAVCYAKFLSE